MTKRAVVVGVDDYSVQKAKSVTSCVNDSIVMVDLLHKGFDFDLDQIDWYINSQATSERVRKAIRSMLNASEPGDVACFFFSGHGALIPSKITGVAHQAIVPYSGRLITDWDLNQAAFQLPRSEINFTVIINSCHSGGMIDPDPRAQSLCLKNSKEFVTTLTETLHTIIPFGVAASDPDIWDHNVTEVIAVAQDTLVACTESPDRQFTDWAKATLLASSRWNEYSRAGAPLSVFVQALYDIVSNECVDFSYSEMQKKIAALTIPKGQHPVLRGQANRMNDVFLSSFTDSR